MPRGPARSLLTRILARAIPGLTTAAAFVGIGAVLQPLSGGPMFDGVAVFRVGLPSLVGGMLFFPVSAERLTSRWRFTLRSLLAGAAAATAHRIMVWGGSFTVSIGTPGPTRSLSGMLANLIDFLLHPQLAVLLPHVGRGRAVDGTLVAEGIAVLLATGIGFAIHPMLKAALRPGASRVPDRPSTLEEPATEASRADVRIR